MGKTLFDKIWDAHVVQKVEDGPTQLYIDRLYAHEVTSPQAFDALRDKGIKAFRPDHVVAMPDHNTPSDQQTAIGDPIGCKQVETLAKNCSEFGIKHFSMGTKDNGIIHVVGPEKALSLPGMTIVCGDSHTSTHGAVGAIAMGIGTSEVAQVLASQCILQSKPKTMRINVEGKLQPGVTAKDVALYIMAQMTTSGATGYAVEYAGSVVREMSMEGRLTLSNLSIEMGSRAGLIAPNETTFAYLKGREYAPKGAEWDAAVARWSQLKSDEDAVFDKEVTYRAEDIKPRITYGTNPGAGIAIDECIPTTDGMSESEKKQFLAQLDYMQFKPGEKLEGHKVDYVFLGACTNGRIEDFRAFASVVKGKKKHPDVVAWLVPGSWLVRQQIIDEGIDKILADAGFELRLPSCSSCLAMNPDKVPAGKLSISTSNRNFVGRQGPGARTILASPLTVAASAITGVVTNPQNVTISELPVPAEVRKVVDATPSNCPNCAFPQKMEAAAAKADGAKSAHRAFNVVKSTCLPINIDNNNTDNIIPARYLAFTTRDPKFYGDAFMHDIRFDANNQPVASFIMNQAPFNEVPSEGKREIIIGGKNWGSGSSREHAAWAIAGYGIRVVISSSFADIHRNNLLNCFVLPVIVSEEFRQELLATVANDANAVVTVDVPNQTVTNEATGHSEKFEINGYKKYCLLNGYDDIDYLLSKKDAIEQFEKGKCC
ncbi:MAG: 3-isopropylmalate dehydratase large subunit [Bacteroidales bacterium]|nr:3-isopropylmalate dehydratase large subunit [Bacteroidales bacterium]